MYRQADVEMERARIDRQQKEDDRINTKEDFLFVIVLLLIGIVVICTTVEIISQLFHVGGFFVSDPKVIPNQIH